MKSRITKEELLLFLLIACIGSRILTAIYYIEDIDSLRFSLSLTEYDLLKFQPHFPGYPVFCFFAKIIYLITTSLGITFSIIGGVSTFIIIYYTLKLFEIELISFDGISCTSLIFFNPLLWLMSNRYMPDLMGLAATVAALYYLSLKKKMEFQDLSIGFFLAGVLFGLRLSYTPLLLVPICYHLYTQNKKHLLFLNIIMGCAIWLVPLIWITGLENLYNAALKQTSGHFSDFGGTILTDSNSFTRIINLIRSIWADGLGGYWNGRSWQTFFLSIALLYILSYSVYPLKKLVKDRQYIIVLVSIAIYLFWIFFFQNITYKSRHILPLLVFVIIMINKGIVRMINKKIFLKTIVLGIYYLSLFNITFVLSNQHKKPTAIAKIKDELIGDSKPKTIISIPLINYYLKSHGVESDFINVEKKIDVDEMKLLGKDSLLIIGDFKKDFLSSYNIIHDSMYYHNPYVNRMWSDINVNKLTIKPNVK